MSSKTSIRLGIDTELSLNLREIYKSQYDRAKEVLSNHLRTILDSASKTPQLLEIGPGKVSLMLESLEDLSEIDFVDRQVNIELMFIEEAERESIEGKNLQVQTKVAKAPATHSLGGINLVCRFKQKNFDKFINNKQRISPKSFNLIAMQATLHELYVASTKPAYSYFPLLMTRLHEALRPGGILFIGDFYYAPYQSSVMAYSRVENLLLRAKHGNAPASFMHPEALLYLTLKDKKIGFEVLYDEEMGAALGEDSGEFSRKFYIIVLRKIGKSK